MKLYLVLILTTLSTSLFSQGSKLVYEIVSGKDTLVVMPKYHAKELAKERVMFQSAIEEAAAKDSQIENLNQSLFDYKGINSQLKTSLYLTQEENNTQKLLLDNYKENVDLLEKSFSKQLKNQKWYIIGGTILS